MRFREIVLLAIVVLAAFVCTALLSATPVETEKKATPTDPKLGTESQAWIRLNMRKEEGKLPFIYPCIWEEKNKSKLIEFKIIEGVQGDVQNIQLDVFDKEDNVVWSKSDFALQQNQWKDSGFTTRTNVATSKDTTNKINRDSNGKFKLLDTKSAPGGNHYQYSVRLTVTTVRTTLIAKLNFHARQRNIWYIESGKSSFESNGKAYMWKSEGLDANQTDLPVDPVENGTSLYLGINPPAIQPAPPAAQVPPTPINFTLLTAFECLTPRGKFNFVGHGIYQPGPNGTKIPRSEIETLDKTSDNQQTIFAGFKGPSSNNTPGTKAGGEYLDLTNHLQSHGTEVFLCACWTADKHMDVNQQYIKSVIESFKDAVSETIGGGGKVTGYHDEFFITNTNVLPLDVVVTPVGQQQITPADTVKIQQSTRYTVGSDWLHTHRLNNLSPMPNGFYTQARLDALAVCAETEFGDTHAGLKDKFHVSITIRIENNAEAVYAYKIKNRILNLPSPMTLIIPAVSNP